MRFFGSRVFPGILALALAAVGTAASAQGAGPGGPGGGPGSGHTFFDPDSIATYEGRIDGETGPWNLWGHGNHTGGGASYAFTANDGTGFDLMLAPAWFLQENGVVLQVGDQIVVAGSRVEPYDGGRHHGPGAGPGHGWDNEHDYLIATVLTVRGVTLRLRDADGYPLWRGGIGWDDHWFDPGSVATLDGRVEQIRGLWSAWGHGNHTGSGMHVLFRAGGEEYYAMLGPWWYLQRAGIELADGQRVRITGSIVDPYWSGYQDHAFLIATEISVDGKVLGLRDEWGYPLWRGTGWYYECPAWDAATVRVLSGTVRRVRERANGPRLDPGYELIVRSEGRNYRVFVAPAWDVAAVGMTLRRGDRITLRGSFGGGSRPSVVAEYVDAPSGSRWRFRNAQGSPIWVTGAR